MIFVDRSPLDNRLHIRASFETMADLGIVHAPVVYFARLLGLSFPDFIRMCRDKYGARIKGRGGLFPNISFDDEYKPALTKLTNEMNRRHYLFIQESKKNDYKGVQTCSETN